MLAVGDLILGDPKPDSTFALVTPIFKRADVLIGQRKAIFHGDSAVNGVA